MTAVQSTLTEPGPAVAALMVGAAGVTGVAAPGEYRPVTASRLPTRSNTTALSSVSAAVIGIGAV